MLWVLICTVNLTVCSYYVMYTFESESILYSCLNVKELLAQSRREIWSLSDCNGTWIHNHLVRKRTLNHLAKEQGVGQGISCFLFSRFCWALSLPRKFWATQEWNKIEQKKSECHICGNETCGTQHISYHTLYLVLIVSRLYKIYVSRTQKLKNLYIYIY